jgi:hypothetical protein
MHGGKGLGLRDNLPGWNASLHAFIWVGYWSFLKVKLYQSGMDGYVQTSYQVGRNCSQFLKEIDTYKRWFSINCTRPGLSVT